MKRAMEPRFASEAFKVCREVVGTVDSITTFDRELADIGEDTTESEEEAAENEGNEQGDEGLDENEQIEEEAAENEESEDASEGEDSILKMTMDKIKSKRTKENRPSPSKRARRECTKKYNRRK